jgi:hypothetical protein
MIYGPLLSFLSCKGRGKYGVNKQNNSKSTLVHRLVLTRQIESLGDAGKPLIIKLLSHLSL